MSRRLWTPELNKSLSTDLGFAKAQPRPASFIVGLQTGEKRLAYEKCPVCGHEKHQLMACPSCGFTRRLAGVSAVAVGGGNEAPGLQPFENSADEGRKSEMQQDGVSAAFEVILEELETVAEEVNEQGTRSWERKNFDQATSLLRTAKELAAFRGKLEALKDEWIKGHDVATRSRVRINNVQSIAPHHKSPKTGLRVTFPNGRVIHHEVAADTFVSAIQEFGLDRVRATGQELNGYPLISDKSHADYSQHRVGTWWVMTHCNTKTKKKLLLRIADALKIPVQVQILT